jgi:hypothetical protein
LWQSDYADKSMEEGKMAKFLLVYYGGQVEPDADPKTVEKTMAVWTKWFADLGKAVADMGAPTQLRKLVTKSGVKSVGAKPVAGYTILQAENLDAAIAMAKSHPDVAKGMKVGVYPLAQM